jgi:hypothetical protein
MHRDSVLNCGYKQFLIIVSANRDTALNVAVKLTAIDVFAAHICPFFDV